MAEVTVYASAARTATPTAVVLNCQRARGLVVVIDATAVTATPSVVCTLDGFDVLSGKYFNILTAAAVTAVSTKVLKIAPGITVAANLAVADVVPESVRVLMTHGDADSITYTVSAHLLR